MLDSTNVKVTARNLQLVFNTNVLKAVNELPECMSVATNFDVVDMVSANEIDITRYMYSNDFLTLQ